MKLFTPRRPQIVAESKLKRLGRLPGGDEVVRVGSDEYILGSEVEPEDTRDGGVFASFADVATDPDTGQSLQVGSKLRRLIAVEAGSYERVQARRRATGPKPMQLVDALALPALSAKPPFSLPPPGTEALAPSLGNRRLTGVVEGSGKVRGRALLDFLKSKGIVLEVYNGALLASAEGGRMLTTLREVIEIAQPLLIGYVTGEPALCELCPDKARAEAWTILVGSVVACERCATAPRQTAGEAAA